MKLFPVEISCADARLAGLVYQPDRPPKSIHVVMAHGFTAGKYSLDSLASYLAERGYRVLTFDFVGHKLGGSTGEMRHASQAVENVEAALAWMRTEYSPTRVALVGHSMGGFAVINAAARDPLTGEDGSIVGVASLCAGLEPSRGFGSTIGKAMLTQRSDYVWGAPVSWLIEELNELAEGVRHIAAIPALIVAATQDVVMSQAQVASFASLAGPLATYASIDSSHMDAPDRSRSAVLQWLDGLESGG